MHWEDLNHYLFYDGAKAAIAINYTLLLVSTTVSCKLSACVISPNLHCAFNRQCLFRGPELIKVEDT